MNSLILEQLEGILKQLSRYEKKGLDTSSLKIFIKNYRIFLKSNGEETDQLTFEDKLVIVKNFLEDKKAFPTIRDIISFANDKLGLNFKDQKASREMTILRILGRIRTNPSLKETLKSAIRSIRNEKMHGASPNRSQKELISAVTFDKWATIILKI